MATLQLSKCQQIALVTLAVLGFLGPNGVFIYFSLVEPAVLYAAFDNAVSLAFMGESFLLMGLFAWLINHQQLKPGWVVFIIMSLIGSLAFSVPAYLVIVSRRVNSFNKVD